MVTYYYVGGYVRDELLGVKSKDVDFAVEANSYEEMRDDLLSQGATIWQERPQFFAIRAKHPSYGNADFTLCRKEGFYSDNRHPDSVEIGTIYDDLARRDFTVNAIAKTARQQYLDPHEGIRDLKSKLLTCVGNTEDRFTEDPLRILRAVRFHIVGGFTLSDEIKHGLHNPHLIMPLIDLPKERIYEELYKCYKYDTWSTMMFFEDYSLLQSIVFYKGRLKLEPVI